MATPWAVGLPRRSSTAFVRGGRSGGPFDERRRRTNKKACVVSRATAMVIRGGLDFVEGRTRDTRQGQKSGVGAYGTSPTVLDVAKSDHGALVCRA
jgi:hypothetical protein